MWDNPIGRGFYDARQPLARRMLAEIDGLSDDLDELPGCPGLVAAVWRKLASCV